jgi:S-adenosylmethionine synthetase
VTGRKIIVDTYGGWVPHGGGAFSGKDPSKVDRSASYMARYIAKNCVTSGLCDEMPVRLAYVIGKAEPTDLPIDTRGTAVIDEAELLRLIWDLFLLKPRDLIKHLNLLQPIYQPTSAYGQFGRKPFKKKVGKSTLDFFPW